MICKTLAFVSGYLLPPSRPLSLPRPPPSESSCDITLPPRSPPPLPPPNAADASGVCGGTRSSGTR
eukprot:1242786-Rhodomonas_salina.1